MTPVIMPPVRKEMRHGLKFEKSFEGDTTLAATLSAVEPVEEEVFVISMSRQRLANVRAGIRDVKDLAECPCRELHACGARAARFLIRTQRSGDIGCMPRER